MTATATTLFQSVCLAHGLPVPVPEYQFAPPRKWRFDWAWLDEESALFRPAKLKRRVALEVQGALFTRGRHSRGAALLKEHEKLNAAAARGWRVLFTTPKQFANGDILADLAEAMTWCVVGGSQ